MLKGTAPLEIINEAEDDEPMCNPTIYKVEGEESFYKAHKFAPPPVAPTKNLIVNAGMMRQ